VAATGDPHLQNVHGERFDLMNPGKHVLINIPKGDPVENALFRVVAEASRLGGECADMYWEGLAAGAADPEEDDVDDDEVHDERS